MIGKEIKRIRITKGVTRYRMSKESGLPMRTVINVEEAKTDPRLSSINKMLGVLGVEFSIKNKENFAE